MQGSTCWKLVDVCPLKFSLERQLKKPCWSLQWPSQTKILILIPDIGGFFPFSLLCFSLKIPEPIYGHYIHCKIGRPNRIRNCLLVNCYLNTPHKCIIWNKFLCKCWSMNCSLTHAEVTWLFLTRLVLHKIVPIQLFQEHCCSVLGTTDCQWFAELPGLGRCFFALNTSYFK